MKFEKLKVAPKENVFHVVSKAEKDCVAQLYVSKDPLLGRSIFNLITVEEVTQLDRDKLALLGRLIDELPVLKDELMTIKKKVGKNEDLPTIVNLNEEDLSSLYASDVKPLSFNDLQKGELLFQVGKPLDFELSENENVITIPELSTEMSVNEFQDFYVFTDKNLQEVISTNKTLSKVASDFLKVDSEMRDEGFKFLKYMRDKIRETFILDPGVQMELTLLESVINKYDNGNCKTDQNVFDEKYTITDEDWSNAVESTNKLIKLPFELEYDKLFKLGNLKNILEQTVGPQIWDMSKEIFDDITKCEMSDIRVLNIPASYEAPLEKYINEVREIGIEKELSDITINAIKKVYSPDEVKLFAVGDIEVLFVQDQFHESLYFFPSEEALTNTIKNSNYRL